MHIMTKDGWKPLSPRVIAPTIHVPSMLEVMGITEKYDGAKAMAEYANGSGHGYYFHYNADGTHTKRNP